MYIFGLEFVKESLLQLDYTKLILVKSELVSMWFIFENFYIKSDYDRMNIVWMILIKITFGYVITKIDISFIL